MSESGRTVERTGLEELLRRDRSVTVGALVLVIVLAWSYTLLGAGMSMTAFEMTARSTAGGMPFGAGTGDGDRMTEFMQPAVWTPVYAVLMFFMWWIMMIAMMLPSASPMILLYAAASRKQRRRGPPYVPAGIFTLGYIVTWGAFSLAATALQWGLERAGLLSAMMTSASTALGGILLVAAGVWQLTPLKHACLRHCRSPLFFLAHHWRRGRLGAFRMGLEHGVFCLGCCWLLMALLFYGGVMNLYWVAGLAAFVLLEKVIPAGHWLGSAAGIALVGWGAWLLAGGL